jgi:peptide/nickel transport system permease protein
MYLAGSIILMISVLTVIGTLISDILLAWLDPRIRYQYQ